MEIYRPNWKKPACVSVLLHICIFTLATLGLPYFTTTPEPEDIIIAVEMVDIAEFAQTDNLDEPDKSEEEDTPAPPPKPVYNNTDTVPDLLSPKEPDITPEPVEEVEEIPEPPKEDEPKVDITEIKEPPKPKNKPKPKPKPPEPKAEPVKQQADSMFKDLMDRMNDDHPSPAQEKKGKGTTSQKGDISTVLTTTEYGLLGSGISPCWVVDIGQRYSDDLYVEVFVTVNRDRTVKTANILPKDNFKYKNNARFRAAADLAINALLNQECRTLKLPEDKYHLWKEFTLPFDPSSMMR